MAEDNRVYRDLSVNVVRNGFIVHIGCQHFVFNSPESLAEAISDYYKNPQETENAFMSQDMRGNEVPPPVRADDEITSLSPHGDSPLIQALRRR